MLTPIELQGKAFKTGFGYDKKDVEAFLKDLIKDYEHLYKENFELNEKVSVLNEGLSYYKSIEKTLQKALVLAEKAAQDTEAAAKVKAEAIEKEAVANATKCTQEAVANAEALISNARTEAKDIVLNANIELDKKHLEIASLVQTYQKYKIQYKQFVIAQMELLESEAFDIDFEKLPLLSNNIEQKEEQKDIKFSEKDEVDAVVDTTYKPKTEIDIEKDVIETNESIELEVSDRASDSEELEYDTKNDDDFVPIIDIKTILAEVEAEEKKKNGVQSQSSNTSKSDTPLVELKPNEPVEVIVDNEELEEMTEKELLQKLFGDQSNKILEASSNDVDSEFEFLNI